LLLLLGLWWLLCRIEAVPAYMLPSPSAVVKAFVNDFSLLMSHSKTTLFEGLFGLGLSVILSLVLSVLMDEIRPLRRAVYPLLVLSQTIPVMAIAPLLVLWLGYGITPRIVLVVLMCFFPVTIGLLDGFSACDEGYIHFLKTLRANRWQVLVHAKLPMAMPHFFAALKISAAYSIVGAVISEWLGGNEGLGVYMTRVRKSYSFDKMFAVILLIMLLSLMLMLCIALLQKICTPQKK